MEKLKYWAHKILPLVYDDSLSYYEVLAKVCAKINEVIDFVQLNITTEMRELLNQAFIDATYDESTETITIYLNIEDVGA